MLKKILSILFYGILAIFVIGLIMFILMNIDWPLKNDLPKKEIISSGYKFLVFGSQNSKGIELYDLESEKLIPFLIPENKNVRYIEPVVGISGKGYCIKEENIFDLAQRKGEIIAFNLNTLDNRSTKNIIKQKFAKLAISPDESKLAFIFTSMEDVSPRLGIYNTAKEHIEKTIPVDKRFFEEPINILWTAESKNVILGSTLRNAPAAIKVDIESGLAHELANFPLDFKDNYMLIMDAKRESVYLENLENNNRHIFIKKNATGHSFSLSRDGKYFVFGWLGGMGFETLTIMDIKSERKFQIKLENHPSTVLGLTLW